VRPQLGVAPVGAADAARYGDVPVRMLLQGALPFVNAPSGYMKNNGVFIVGQLPASSATATFSATSGSGVTCTFSAATLAGSASDAGRVLTIFDTTYKYFTVTGNSGSSTTVCQGTLSGGALSTVGAFANSALWLTSASATIITGYSAPLPRVVGNSYTYMPANGIYAGSAAGWYFTVWASTTVATVYNNIYSTGQPSVPASPTAFATTGNGYLTSTSPLNGPNVVMPGNSMGVNGALELWLIVAGNANSANAKAARLVIEPSTNVGQIDLQGNTNGGGIISWSNQGVANSQYSFIGGGANGGDMGGSSASPNITAIDTTVNQTVAVGYNKSLNNDSMIFERYSIKLFPTSP